MDLFILKPNITLWLQPKESKPMSYKPYDSKNKTKVIFLTHKILCVNIWLHRGWHAPCELPRTCSSNALSIPSLQYVLCICLESTSTPYWKLKNTHWKSNVCIEILFIYIPKLIYLVELLCLIEVILPMQPGEYQTDENNSFHATVQNNFQVIWSLQQEVSKKWILTTMIWNHTNNWIIRNLWKI